MVGSVYMCVRYWLRGSQTLCVHRLTLFVCVLFSAVRIRGPLISITDPINERMEKGTDVLMETRDGE